MWPFKIQSQTFNEENFKNIEMCDVCCHTFNNKYITRYKFEKHGIRYVVRCCPYCNPKTLLDVL